jgi:predicted TIM-barrel fold metal-dependent hydrolase
MILMIDLCCDIGNYAFRPWPANDTASTLAEMDRAGIDQAVVGSIDAITYVSPHPANELLMDDIKNTNAEGRLIPYTVLSPVYPGVEQDMRESREMGFRGLKLYPNYHGYQVDDPPALSLIEMAAGWDWPTIISVRIEDERHHHPLMKVSPVPLNSIIWAARQLPEATIIVSAANGGETPRILQLSDELPNLHVELSYVKGPIAALAKLVAQFGSQKMMLGTHLPFVYPGCGIAKIAEADISEQAKQDILEGNARRILRL